MGPWRVVRLLRPLRNRLFRRFFGGQALSQVGDFAFLVALEWQVILLGGGTTEVGIALSAFMAGQVPVLLAGGVIVDRFPRRWVVVASDVVQAGLTAGGAALIAAGNLSLLPLYVLAATLGAAAGISLPALSAFLPETIPPGEVQEANSLYQASRSVAALAGPALSGSLILAVGTAGAFAFDAATFGVSALLLGSARMSAVPPRAMEGTPSPLAQVREGFRYVRRVPWLWITIVAFMVINVAEAGPRNSVLPVFVGVELGAGVTGIGLGFAAMGVGDLVGLVVPNFVPRVRRRGTVAYAVTALAGGTVALLAFTGALWQVMVLMALRGAFLGVYSLLWTSSMMEYVDERLRGRAFSLDMLGSFALLPVAMAGAGFLAALTSARTVFLWGGVTIVGIALAGLAYGPAHRFGPAPGSPSEGADG